MDKIKIQPEIQKDGTLPYPFFVNWDSTVGRQDFWKGNPLSLAGFVRKTKRFKVALSVNDFFNNPEKCIGLFPVFLNKDLKMYTFKIRIGSVQVITI